jgi:hypothetical protein
MVAIVDHLSPFRSVIDPRAGEQAARVAVAPHRLETPVSAAW